jgi:phospholipid/cholesterol/gamma-HCH transport system ATP-binding protein
MLFHLMDAAPEPPGCDPDAGTRAERPLLEVVDLTKRYGDKTVLDQLDLTVERGETLAIIGASGSGKSTLARHIVGLERPTSGHIYLDGVDITLLSDYTLSRTLRRFAMVFQRHALLDSMSVFDNIAFPLREETDLDEETIRERVTAQLVDLGLEDAADKLPGQISGGMAKRVGIARAMVIEPEFLIYDEPTSGLDPITSRVVDGLIDHMRDRFFVTSIVITHDMATVFDVADRVVVLAQGKIVAEATPDTIFNLEYEEIQAFLRSSAVDPARLAPRSERKSPAQIRELWRERHCRTHAPPIAASPVGS